MSEPRRVVPPEVYDRKLEAILAHQQEFERTKPANVPELIARQAAARPDAPFVIFEGRQTSYGEMNGLANRYARWAANAGLKPGDCVALFMENRPEFYSAVFGLSRAGLVVALINNSLTGQGLAHCARVANARAIVLGAEQGALFQTARDLFDPGMPAFATGGAVEGAETLDGHLAAESAAPIPTDRLPDRGLTDLFVYVYTSGTTGLPKATRGPHGRFLNTSSLWSALTDATPADRMYCCLPLYHVAGFSCASGAMIVSGGTIVLRRKFSARAFWKDCVEHEASLFQYIGELCRYLLNTPHDPAETQHKIRACFGNGMRPEVWGPFKERFKIPAIYEVYGATDGNFSFLNLDQTIGPIGRITPKMAQTTHIRFVRFDYETEQPWRGPDGFCVLAEPGEAGEAIGKVSDAHRFEGYTSKEATEKKLLHDVFEKGDTWYRSGDLMMKDKDGYVWFVDRIGDTFRWKGENVASGEVSGVISQEPGVSDVTVYGVAVPGHDGRAGMATITAGEALDLDKLHARLAAELPHYARPLFLRVRGEIEITGTFKHRKMDLVKEGFNPAAVAEPLYFNDPKANAYVPIDPALYEEIVSGRMKI